MKDDKMIFLKSIILLDNLLALGFVFSLLYVLTRKVCTYNSARSFMDNAERIPENPVILAIYVGVLSTILVVDFILRERVYADNIKAIFQTLAVDFFACMGIIFLLDFNYNGILFWFFANMLLYISDKGKYLFFAVAIFTYIITDFQIVSIRYNLFSIKTYMQFFDAASNQYYLGIYNLLISINIVLSIVFCVWVIQKQKGIIQEVNDLYEKLSTVNTELREANRELKEYADMKESMGKTKERNRLAREIHDTLGHALTGILAGLDACMAIIDINPKETKKQLDMLANVTREGISEVRRSVNELRPDALERLSLRQAILKMLEDYREITSAKIEFDCEAEQLKFDEDEETTIYRIIQESITNAVRHGGASEIKIRIIQKDGKLNLFIKDNGKGCAEIKNGFGIKHMGERIEMLHGSLTVSGDDGFSVDAVIPIRWGEDYD